MLIPKLTPFRVLSDNVIPATERASASLSIDSQDEVSRDEGLAESACLSGRGKIGEFGSAPHEGIVGRFAVEAA